MISFLTVIWKNILNVLSFSTSGQIFLQLRFHGLEHVCVEKMLQVTHIEFNLIQTNPR
jgi:hypothetical protein